jgi:hypothetical protein
MLLKKLVMMMMRNKVSMGLALLLFFAGSLAQRQILAQTTEQDKAILRPLGRDKGRRAHRIQGTCRSSSILTATRNCTLTG